MRLPVIAALLAAWLPGPAYADVLSIAVTPTSVSFGAATVLGNSIVRQISLIAGGPPIAVSIAIFVQTDCVKGQPAQCPWSEVTLTSPNCNVVPHLTSPSVYVIDVPLNFACLVNVAFRPTSVGPRQGQLFFPDNFPSPLIVPLDGIGVASEAIEVSATGPLTLIAMIGAIVVMAWWLTTRSTGPAGTGLLSGERPWRRAG